MLLFTSGWVEAASPPVKAPTTAAPGAAGPDTPDIPADVVAENLAWVQDLVSKHGQADVIVYLRLPDDSAQASARHIDQIAAVQASVLSDLSVSEFSLHRMFELTPGFSGKVTAGGLRKLANHPDVIMVYEDQLVHADLKESVALINADDVQSLGIRGEGVTVAVLDTGIDTDHPALADDLLGQKCFTHSKCQPGNTSIGNSAEDDEGHGTSVAGIITSSGAVPSMPALGAGVAPDAGIVAVKVLDNAGGGYLSDWLYALQWVIDNQAAYEIRVANMSLGTNSLYESTCDSSLPNLRDVVNIAVSKGIAVFAASGNDASSTSLSAPACLSNMISVGAVYDSNFGGRNYSNCTDNTSYSDKVICYSNLNTMLDVLAPSYRNATTGLGGIEFYFGGTSAASPHAAGVAALLLASDPNLTPAAIEQRLKTTGESINVTRGAYSYTFPRIDALAALLAGGDPSCVSLTLGSSPASGGTIYASPAPNCNWGTEYIANTDVTITAIENPSYTFYQWSGDAAGNANPLALKITADKTITANFVGDAYEVDDSSAQAKMIIDGVQQTHSIIPAGDVDYVRFSLDSTSAVQLETSGAAGGDTYMWLYNGNQTLIGEDNNSGAGNYSRILRTCTEGAWLPAGTYYVQVNNYYYSEILSYQLSYLKTQTCTNAPPEIDVRYAGNGTSIANGDSLPSAMDGTHFGLAKVTGSTRRIFRVWNTGGADLLLSGSPQVVTSGENAADFSVDIQPIGPIPAGDNSVQFVVKFTPSGTGIRTAKINIASNDSDENPYTFAIQGLGVSTLYNVHLPVVAR